MRHVSFRWLRRLLLAASVTCVTFVTAGQVSIAAPIVATRAGTWSWPFDAPRALTRDYDAPLTPYASGHRGVDIPAFVGDEVLAPADGTVSFAGVIVDRGVLSIAIGNYTASFEPVAAIVNAGENVHRGDVIAHVSAGPHCECLHVGARKGENYLSPMAFFSEIPRAVLMPWSEP